MSSWQKKIKADLSGLMFCMCCRYICTTIIICTNLQRLFFDLYMTFVYSFIIMELCICHSIFLYYYCSLSLSLSVSLRRKYTATSLAMLKIYDRHVLSIMLLHSLSCYCIQLFVILNLICIKSLNYYSKLLNNCKMHLSYPISY